MSHFIEPNEDGILNRESMELEKVFSIYDYAHIYTSDNNEMGKSQPSHKYGPIFR